MGQNGKFLFPEKVDEWRKHPDGEEIGHGARAASRRRIREISRVSGPDEELPETGQCSRGTLRVMWAVVFGRSREKLTVILLVDGYVLVVEIRYKIEKKNIYLNQFSVYPH